MIELEVNGTPYNRFTSAQAEVRLDALSNSFSFVAASSKDNLLPFRGGESCRVLVNGNPVVTGFIELINVSYSASGHSLTISGRDKTADLVDSTISNTPDIRPKISLKKVIEQMIDHVGADIKVIDNSGAEDFEKPADLPSPEIGNGVFAFLEEVARKRQVLLTSDGDGNLVITRSQAINSGSAIENILGSNNNSVINATAIYDRTGRFNLYKAASQLNPVALRIAGKTDLASVVDQSGRVLDPAIRASRQYAFVTESQSSDKDSLARAEWERNIRKARSLVYNATVSGHVDADGNIWEPNKLVSIIDDFAGINDLMLLNSAVFRTDISSGDTTFLEFLTKDAYQLSISEPQAEEEGFSFA